MGHTEGGMVMDSLNLNTSKELYIKNDFGYGHFMLNKLKEI